MDKILTLTIFHFFIAAICTAQSFFPQHAASVMALSFFDATPERKIKSDTGIAD